MKRLPLGFAILLSLVTYGTSLSAPPVDIAAALSDNPVTSQQAIAGLRDAGPAGLRALLDQYDKSPDSRLIPVIDAVAGQRDALTSRLYWYTDVANASAVAEAAHKPVLYLRLLGKLTDEYSCANSRFFRTVLYANSDVSKFMREHFVLVWVSERPVPVVTIDYGDGRVLKRTITGNSIHYILTSKGRVIDALPGLYDPKTFVSVLANAATSVAISENAAWYTKRTEAALRYAWQADVQKVAPNLAVAGVRPAAQFGQAPDARVAMKLAKSKAFVEAPVLAGITPAEFAARIDRNVDSAEDASWQKIASLHLGDAALDASSIALIRSQDPSAYSAAGALDRTVQQLQQSIAMDTVHNNYQFRRRILSWLRESPGEVHVEDLNRRVYAELFLTPRTDPWLGMAPENTYSALSGDGRVVSCRLPGR